MKQLMKQLKQTPIEILLQVDGEGKTTARKLYEFLNLAKGQFSRWAKTNILENAFAENGIDFEGFDINVEGNLTKDYKLTASFAKKLAMSCQNERGEQAREYFIKVEEKLKQVATKKENSLNNEKQQKLELQKMRAEAMKLNAQTRAFNSLMKSLDNKKLSPVAMQVFGLKGLEGIFGVDVSNLLPKVEKTYSAKEVGDMLGISANKVGRLANANSLKTPEYGRYVADKSKNSDKEVETFRYNETGVKVLQELAW